MPTYLSNSIYLPFYISICKNLPIHSALLPTGIGHMTIYIQDVSKLDVATVICTKISPIKYKGTRAQHIASHDNGQHEVRSDRST